MSTDVVTTAAQPAVTDRRQGPQESELLLAACAGRGFHTVFQPILDVARGVVAGYESLTRFDESPGNPLPWFAAARAGGREPDLEAATLRSAFAARTALPPNCFLTVNVSPASLGSEAVRQ